MDKINKIKLELLPGQLILEKYLLIKKIGEGAFGKIYKAECDNQNYAIKIEKKRKGCSLLKTEAEIMQLIQGSK
jgi:predicted Ser/Thr protein kinase